MNDQQAYAVNLYINGIKRTIIVDNYLVCFQRTNNLAFCKSKKNELWVPILEKCWAKACGSFDWTIGGLTKEAFRSLTGAPATQYLHDFIESDYLWRKLKNADRQRYAMCTSMGDSSQYSGGDRAISNIGLFTGHAYSLIGVYEVELSNGKKKKLVKIRNPHGNTEWKGDWSDHSQTWTDDLRYQVDHKIEDDGTFFMAFEDYYAIYTQTTICKYHDDYVSIP